MSRRRPLRMHQGRESRRPDRDSMPAPRSRVSFACPQGHLFTVPFAATAQPPDFWTCRQHGIENCRHVEELRGNGVQTKPKRTHLTMLLERRTVAELDALLTETLAAIRHQGGPRPGCLRLGDRDYSFRFNI